MLSEISGSGLILSNSKGGLVPVLIIFLTSFHVALIFALALKNSLFSYSVWRFFSKLLQKLRYLEKLLLKYRFWVQVTSVYDPYSSCCEYSVAALDLDPESISKASECLLYTANSSLALYGEFIAYFIRWIHRLFYTAIKLIVKQVLSPSS